MDLDEAIGQLQETKAKMTLCCELMDKELQAAIDFVKSLASASRIRDQRIQDLLDGNAPEEAE